jgi:inorganic pyrophosphatase
MESRTIIIESTRNSQVKFKFDEEKKVYREAKSLPLGMHFPYDFGFIPKTKGSDGDPLDAMVISEFPFFPGARVDCRLIGALKAEQRSGTTTIRNDRYFFISDYSIVFAHIRNITDFSAAHNEQLGQFFINYNKAEDKYFTPLQWLNALQAEELLSANGKNK